jgi:hypothetical protein
MVSEFRSAFKCIRGVVKPLRSDEIKTSSLLSSYPSEARNIHGICVAILRDVQKLSTAAAAKTASV